MTISVKHRFLSAKSDSLDSTRVQPSNWNDTHDIEMGPSAVIGRGSGAGNADAEELPAGITGRAVLAAADQATALTAIGGAAASSATTATTVAAAIVSTATKAIPADADSVTIIDSAAANVMKRVLWSAVKSTLKTYFDTLYAAVTTQLIATWQTGTGVIESVISPAKLKAAAISAGGGAPDAVLEDQKASGTDGGTFTSGAWQPRILNTKVRDAGGIISLAVNQFVSTVDGWIEWEAPSAQCGNNQSRLFNVTDAVAVAQGTSIFNSFSSENITFVSRGGAPIIAGKTYRIEHRCTGNRNTIGFGQAVSLGTEIYTRVKIWRTA